MSISNIMKNRRNELGLTLKYIADFLGVSEATVQRWESGNIKSPRHNRIVKLSEVLKVHPGYLMGWEDKEEQIKHDIPHELKDLSIEWIMVVRKAKYYGFKPEEFDILIETIVNIRN